MTTKQVNNKDCFDNELEIGDIVAVSGCSYATLTKCRVVKFSGKNISVSNMRYPEDYKLPDGTPYTYTMSKRSDQIALVERKNKVDSGVKLYTRKEVEYWRNDMVDGILSLVERLKDAPISAIIDGIKGMKSNG